MAKNDYSIINTKTLIGLAILVVVLSVGAIIISVVLKKKEGYRAPCAFNYRGNYHGHDYGFGTNIVQTDWTRGAFFQMYPPLNQSQGLYDGSCEWAPRYIRDFGQAGCGQGYGVCGGNYCSSCRK